MKIKILGARLQWVSSFTDPKQTKFTALEDMAPVVKTSTKSLTLQLNGKSSREVTLRSLAHQSPAKNNKLNSFIIPRYFLNDKYMNQEI
jgi:hypothetical protein